MRFVRSLCIKVSNHRNLNSMRVFAIQVIFMGVMVVCCLSSCHLAKTTNTATPDAVSVMVPWVIKYERGPCFGECPVYTFFLLEDNSGLVEARYNLLDPPGWYASELDQEEVHELLNELEPEAWWHEDLSQLPEISDLPVMSLLYKHKDGLRWYAVQSKMSDLSSRIFTKLDHLVREARWVPTTKRPLSPDVPEPTDVIVQLKDGVDIHAWMKSYERFGIKLKKRVSPNLNYYVVSKDPGMGSANDFLQYIKLDDNVIGAQWDQELTPRNQ